MTLKYDARAARPTRASMDNSVVMTASYRTAPSATNSRLAGSVEIDGLLARLVAAL